MYRYMYIDTCDNSIYLRESNGIPPDPSVLPWPSHPHGSWRTEGPHRVRCCGFPQYEEFITCSLSYTWTNTENHIS